jgi:hypothetical protein
MKAALQVFSESRVLIEAGQTGFYAIRWAV